MIIAKLISLIYKDGFRYGALCFLIFVSIPSCMACCNQYVVSCSYSITLLPCCISMLNYGLLMIYERVWFETVGVSCSIALFCSFGFKLKMYACSPSFFSLMVHS